MSEAHVEVPPAALVRVFPKSWSSGLMLTSHVGELCGDCLESGTIATRASMGPGWTAKQLELLIVRSTAGPGAERWKVPPNRWRMVMFPAEGAHKHSPMGMVVFYPVLLASRRTGRLVWFWLSIDLLWILPGHRGRGYGKHLVAHLLRYLRSRMREGRWPAVARRGLEVVVHAEIHNDAAHRLVGLVRDDFELQRELAAEGEVEPGAWRIRSVELEED